MNILIDAGPGSGKTFSLVYGYLHSSNQLVSRLKLTEEQDDIFKFFKGEFKPPFKACFFSHANSVKDKLIKMLPKSTKVYTFHGAGMSAIIKKYGYQKPVNNRIEGFISDITGRPIQYLPDRFQWYAIKRLVKYFKIEDIEPTQQSLQYLLGKYPDLASSPPPEDWQEKVEKLLALSRVPNGCVDYNDMIWMGCRCVTRPIYSVGFVDESQDCSAGMYKLVTRLCDHVVFCGDKNQAINAFAGASEAIYDRIHDSSDAILPLKVTLRNPPSIVDLANTIRPGGVIKGPNTEDGEIRRINYGDLPEILNKCEPHETLIISRTNAAILGSAVYLYQAGFPVQVVDKDLAGELLSFAKSLTANFQQLEEKLDKYEDRANRSPNPLWGQICSDKCDSIRTLVSNCNSYKEFQDLLKATFEKYPKGYPMCSCHKAKGLEAKNVLIINPPIELPIAMSHPIGKEQERNLAFVGITRSSRNIYYVK